MCVITHQVAFHKRLWVGGQFPLLLSAALAKILSNITKLVLPSLNALNLRHRFKVNRLLTRQPDRVIAANRHDKIKLQLIQPLIKPQPLSPYKLSASTNLNRKPIALSSRIIPAAISGLLR